MISWLWYYQMIASKSQNHTNPKTNHFILTDGTFNGNIKLNWPNYLSCLYKVLIVPKSMAVMKPRDFCAFYNQRIKFKTGLWLHGKPATANDSLAQLVERRNSNPIIPGSSPGVPLFFLFVLNVFAHFCFWNFICQPVIKKFFGKKLSAVSLIFNLSIR